MTKQILLILLYFICFEKTYCQINNSSYGFIEVEFIKEKKSKKSNFKPINLSFSNIDSSLVKKLEKSLNESKLFYKRAKKGKYIAKVRFFVLKDSSIADIICEKDPGFGLCTEIVKSIKIRKWSPGSYLVSPLKKSSSISQFQLNDKL